MAGFSLGDILVNIKANTDGLKKGLSDVQNMGNETKALGEKIQKGMNVAAAGLAVVGAGLTVYAKGATDFTIDLVKSSTALGRQLGVSTEEASRLVAALGRMGIDADKASTVFGVFAKKIVEAGSTSEATRIAHENLALQIRQTQMEIAKTTAEIAKNGDKSGELGLKVETLKNKMAGLQDQLKSSASGFDQIGVSVKNADGTTKGFTQILGEVADKFKVMPNGIEKTALSMELFGRSGKDMIKVLNLGSDGIADLEKQADKLGLTLTADTIVKIQALVKAQKDLKQETDALKIAVGTATAPVITKFNEELNHVLSTLLNTKGPVHDATVGFLAFGGPIATAASAVLAFAANATQVAPVMAKMAIALRDTAAAQWLLNIAMDANPIIALVSLIILLIGALVWVSTHMEETGSFMVRMSDRFRELGPVIQGLIVIFMPFIGIPLLIVAYWTPIAGFFGWLWATVTNFFASHWQMILAVTLGPIGIIVGAIIGNFNWIVGFLWGVLNSIVGIMRAIGSWFGSLPGAAAGAANGVVSFFAGIPGRILGAMGNLGGLLSGAGHAIMDGLLGALKGGFSKVQDFVNSIGSWIKSHKGPLDYDQKLLIPAGKAILQGLQTGLNNEWGNVKDFVGNIANDLASSFMSPVVNLAPALASTSAQPLSGSRLAEAAGAAAGPITQHNTLIVEGDIGSKDTADYIMEQMGRNQELARKAIATQAGATGK